MDKENLLNEEIKHVDIASFDTTAIIDAMRGMSFTSREIANSADIWNRMLTDDNCTVILTLAGSTSAAGCMKLYADLIKYNMIDAVVATGASIVDMDFFEALGFHHYKGTPHIDDKMLRNNLIDRIYDTFINEEDLQVCDSTIKKIADIMESGVYSSREFIQAMGMFLSKLEGKTKDSLILQAFQNKVPIFSPAFNDSSAGFGIVKHQLEKISNKENYVSIDSMADLRELTQIKIEAPSTGLFMIGGGSPKNFAQDTVVCAEVAFGKEVPIHQYAVQITVADVRDGACSSSTLKEAASWGKVDTIFEQMVFAEAGSVLPLIASYVYHRTDLENRKRKDWSTLFPDLGTKKWF